LALSFSLAACDGLMKSNDPPPHQKRPPVDDGAQIEADIMVGRVEVMQDQTQRGLELLGARLAPMAELPTDRETYRRLTDASRRYNVLNVAACSAAIVAGPPCQPYMPNWHHGRARPDTSPAGLKAMAEDMQNTMIPLWDAVCAKAKAKSGDEHFCAIE
jgi:hypothetical protein